MSKDMSMDEVLAQGVAIVAESIPALIVWESIREMQEKRITDEYEKRFDR